MIKISYILKRFRKSKHVRLRVKQDGTVLVTAPMRVSVKFVEQFVEKSRVWIERALGDRRVRLGRSEDYLLGQSTSAKLRLDRSLRLGKEKEEHQTYKKHALKLVNERLEYWNAQYLFSWKKVSVRNQSTRWGSCSRSGNLSFNYRVVFLPIELVDYLVVHELCHLKEMNHSVRFWSLVGKTIPDFREKRRELKRTDLMHHREPLFDGRVHRSLGEDGWSVYILRCADETLYTGIALNVDERLVKHNEGKGAKYTRGRGPCVVVWREGEMSEGDARRKEMEMKKMSRKEKERFFISTK